MKRQLTDKQKLFLEYLFHDEVMGDFKKARTLAGYAETNPVNEIVEALKEEIIEYTKLYLARNAPKAAFGVMDVLDQPGKRGAPTKLSAAKEVLDRVGVSKTEKVEVSAAAFILPPKDE